MLWEKVKFEAVEKVGEPPRPPAGGVEFVEEFEPLGGGEYRFVGVSEIFVDGRRVFPGDAVFRGVLYEVCSCTWGSECRRKYGGILVLGGVEFDAYIETVSYLFCEELYLRYGDAGSDRHTITYVLRPRIAAERIVVRMAEKECDLLEDEESCTTVDEWEATFRPGHNA